METVVVKTLTGAIKSREGWEALRKDGGPPLSDVQVTLENIVEEVRRHGLIVAQLAVLPHTRAELKARLPGAIERIPAWMEQQVYGPAPMTAEVFVRGLTQVLGVHREAIERVVAEQVLAPEPIEELLAEAPVPACGEDDGNGEIMEAIGPVIVAHSQALVQIAADLDARVAKA